MTTELHFAVDCGGTACRAALADGAAVWRASGEGANAQADPERAAQAIAAVLEALAREAGLAPDLLADQPGYLAVAGVLDKAAADALRGRLGLARAVVEEDRVAALHGALGPRAGTLLALGTGSFVGRRDGGGTVVFCGGHGPILGDEASGAWLGREALADALRAPEGLAPDGPLWEALRREFGGRAGLIAFAAGARSRDFAAHAPRIASAAAAGDAAALALMARGASYLRAAAEALGWQPGEALCLTGGLADAWAPHLTGAMQAARVPPKGSPLDGALALARALAGGPAPSAGRGA